MFSLGNGEFKHHSDDAPTTYPFSVSRDLTKGQLEITIWSPFLRHMLTFTSPYVLGFVEIVQQYPVLKANLSELEDPNSPCLSAESASELRLLTEDFLLDQSMFSIVNLQYLHNQGIIPETYWRDMQHRSTMNDLMLVDEAFKEHCQDQAEETNENNWHSLCQIASDSPRQADEVENHAAHAQLENDIECSTKLPSKKNHIFEAIKSAISELEPWVEGYAVPVDVEDCLIWKLGSCQISQAELKFLERVTGNDKIVSRIKDLLYHSGLQDTFGLRVGDITFKDLGEGNLNSMNLSLDPKFLNIRRPFKGEKKNLITSRLHAAFKAEDQECRDKVRKMILDQQATGYEKAAGVNANTYGFINRWYYKAWDKGVATIRRFLEGKRPDTLEQIYRLLQVAYVMGSQDPSNPDFRASFFNDLDRWRTIVPEHSLPRFDVIAEAVWKKSFEEVESKAPQEFGFNDTLIQLQELLSGLISDFPLVDTLEKNEQRQEHRKPEYDQSVNGAMSPIQSLELEILDGLENPRAYADVRKLPNCSISPEPVIVLMMAGAIFGFIFSFLLSKDTLLSSKFQCICHAVYLFSPLTQSQKYSS
jgi:hypothetical protein